MSEEQVNHSHDGLSGAVVDKERHIKWRMIVVSPLEL